MSRETVYLSQYFLKLTVTEYDLVKNRTPEFVTISELLNLDFVGVRDKITMVFASDLLSRAHLNKFILHFATEVLGYFGVPDPRFVEALEFRKNWNFDINTEGIMEVCSKLWEAIAKKTPDNELYVSVLRDAIYFGDVKFSAKMMAVSYPIAYAYNIKKEPFFQTAMLIGQQNMIDYLKTIVN